MLWFCFCCKGLLQTCLFGGESKANLNVAASGAHSVKIQCQCHGFTLELRTHFLTKVQLSGLADDFPKSWFQTQMAEPSLLRLRSCGSTSNPTPRAPLETKDSSLCPLTTQCDSGSPKGVILGSAPLTHLGEEEPPSRLHPGLA